MDVYLSNFFEQSYSKGFSTLREALRNLYSDFYNFYLPQLLRVLLTPSFDVAQGL